MKALSNFTFNGERRDYITVLRGKNLPAWAPIQRELTAVPGRPGAVMTRTTTNVRTLSIPVRIKSDSFENLQLLKEDLAAWLVTDEPEELMFDDEPNRSYMAAVDQAFDFTEVVYMGRGTITFVVPDAYKYGPVKTAAIESPMVINSEGSAPTAPTFRLNIASTLTTVNILKGETEYMSIGQPADVEETAFAKTTKLLDDRATTLTGWGSTSIPLDNGAIGGDMLSSGDEFYATNYGSGVAWHGPARFRTFAVCEDYRVRVWFNNYVNKSNQRGRSELYLVSEDGTIIGKLEVSNKNSAMRPTVYCNIRNEADTKTILYKKDAYKGRFYGYIELKKEGINFTVTVVREPYTGDGGYKKKSTEVYRYKDTQNRFGKTLVGVVPHIGAWSSNPGANRARIRKIYVERINESSGDIPFSFIEGDTVEINHQTGLITVNDIDRMDLKDFGANFFKFDPGENTLIIEPIESISGEIEWRDRYK